MRCPETLGHSFAGWWPWLSGWELECDGGSGLPGVLRAVGDLAVRAETSLRVDINAVWPPSQSATCGAYDILSVCKGAAGEAAGTG